MRTVLATVVLLIATTSGAMAADCGMSLNFTGKGGVPVWQTTSGIDAFYFRANSDVNTDGSGRSYHPGDIAANKGLAQNTICNAVNRRTGSGTVDCVENCQACLDHFRSRPQAEMVANFGRFFESFAIALDGRKACVVPDGKANAGFFISTTSYVQPGKGVCDPDRYLDAMVFPSIAVPSKLISKGVAMGDYVLVRNRTNGREAFGVVYDSSGGRIGESSIAMNRLLLCQKNKPGCVPPPPPTKLKESYQLVVADADFLILKGSAGGWPASPEAIATAARGRFEAWGGSARLDRCAKDYRP